MDSKRAKRIELIIETLNDENVIKELGIKEVPSAGVINVKWDLRKEPGVDRGILKGDFTKEFSAKEELVRTIAEFTEVGRQGYGSISFSLEVNSITRTVEFNDVDGIVSINEKDALALLAWAGGNEALVDKK